jgi:steroid 5-alpha reductase family enzyme
MTLLWVVQRRTGNAAIVDAGWAGGIGLAALAAGLFGAGDPARRILVAVLGGGWGLRLAWHLLADRIVGKPEEGRYVALREAWGTGAQRGFFLFYQAQAVLAALLAAPFLLAARDPNPGPGPRDFAALALWLVALVGESIADRQLASFKADPSTRGAVCRRGLWAWSRHPNYFFEWLVWCAFALLATGNSAGLAAWAAPAAMLFFILRVTGIPPTEAQALRSRGDAYRRYQSEVSAFVPLPPRHSTTP